MSRYVYVNNKRYFVADATIHKSIRIDQETFDIINSLEGTIPWSSFSDKLIHLAYYYKYGKQKDFPDNM